MTSTPLPDGVTVEALQLLRDGLDRLADEANPAEPLDRILGGAQQVTTPPPDAEVGPDNALPLWAALQLL
jgi:hypothetical protein